MRISFLVKCVGLALALSLSSCSLLGDTCWTEKDGVRVRGTVAYPDDDGDGYYDNGSVLLSTVCVTEEVDGYSTVPGDCDDSDPNISPDALEVCDDDIDNDCQNGKDCWDTEACGDTDHDGDGYVGDADCNPCDGAVHPGAYEQCGSGVDNNCDGVISLCDGEEAEEDAAEDTAMDTASE